MNVNPSTTKSFLSPQRIAYIKVTVAVVFWGASFIATKIALTNGAILSTEWGVNLVNPTKVALRDVDPVTVVWLRFAMGVAVLGVGVLLRRQFAVPSRKELIYFSVLGFLGITFHQWLQSTGLVTAQASTTAWIVSTTPIFMALLGWLYLKEKLNWASLVGILLAGIGVLLVVSNGDLASLRAGSAMTAGDILILISAPNWAVFSIFSRRGLSRHPAARMMFYVMLAGWLFTSVQFFAGPGLAQVGQLTGPGWLGVSFLGICCSGVAYIFWYDALQSVPASQVGSFLYLEPLVAVAVAGLVLGEAVYLASLVGGAVILLGVWMVQNRPG